MIALLKRIRDAIRPQRLAKDIFISKEAAHHIERIMPGETMNITLNGRQFVILEREEFEVILARGGYAEKQRS